MSYNTLLTAENLEQLQFNSVESQKILASQIPGFVDAPEMIPELLNQHYEFSNNNVNVLPSPETDSLISSPSISNPDDELDLFALQPSAQGQEQLLCGIPGSNSVNELYQASYENALMTILANNQLQSNFAVCDTLANVNDEELLFNYPGIIPMKNQSPVIDPLELTPGLNDIPVETLDQLLNQQSANIEIPSLVPSVETPIGTEMVDPLLLGATNPYLMNELLEANSMIPVNGNFNLQTTSFEQISTPPQSPVNIEDLNAKQFAYISNSSPVDIVGMNFMNDTSNAPNTQPLVLKSMVPSISSQIPLPQVFTPEIEGKKLQPAHASACIQTKTNYTYMPVSKKRSNSDLKGAKLERKSSSKASQKKSVPMIKDKTNKTIQKQQVKHTFVIETPGVNYGKKASGRRRKSKKNEEEENIINLPQIPQVPCRPNIITITPQKLSKIHARTTEDLDSLPFQCEFCPSAFSRKHDLKRHIKIHTGSTPAHKCKHCGKSYARIEALTKHETTKECQK
ncbi:hypothetical protein BCR36DRAFT_583610 [Piromyces finnis]|uniref:C2H2-type domain-containing protein n=1 Tax=Piromyces finnis TaxID=1754191 RepID=A0A1Y1VAQ9_9FUNG|nr:hypothetical protein BCR36DRAFT_583610 [Piromyces finnis]|eukprot:ORX50000.1 hypothetical protein BCR36DRAFT_583610 [Piromyces finnis]